MNAHYIAAPRRDQDRTTWLAALEQYRRDQRADLDLSLYDREDLRWVTRTFVCHFTFMYDRSFYDPDRGYLVESFLTDGRREFGGYDAVLLWQAYPRLGVDERNQFDYYRDMPGGLAGLRDVVRRFHARGVKVFIDYNPWDTGTRREPGSDEEALAELTAAIEADGVFLDTMRATSPVLRERVDQQRSGVAFVPEGHPQISQLSLLSASWAQWLSDPEPPGMLHLKWIEPRHVQYQIRRWHEEHSGEIASAFFNGSGIMVWENIFGSFNPWSVQDRVTCRRAVSLLRQFAANLSSQRWDPFYPTLAEGVFAHRWPGKHATIFTLINANPDQPLREQALLEVEAKPGRAYFDLWHGRPLATRVQGDRVRLIGSLARIGCLLEIPNHGVDRSLEDLLAQQAALARESPPSVDPRNSVRSVIDPEPVVRTKRLPRDQAPPGMVYVPAATITLSIDHRMRECGCFPDPGTPREQWNEVMVGRNHRTYDRTGAGPRRVKHRIGPLRIRSFFVDEAEVTNAQFKQFLKETGYTPRQPRNFLKHWPRGKMPGQRADHPVVYVDIDDARAYARWAGKRLPTEEEWHLAAQGTDGRTWPWGEEPPSAERCNMTGRNTMPVRSCPAGRSPSGCYHMAGNVWEWTESCRDDGHTRFCIIRGGSYFNAKGSKWYVEGGPKPCNHHTKFIRMWPGLDRCGTIGFRCVADAE
jgi:formylglycine-generating enzyme required for sulfatase activity